MHFASLAWLEDGGKLHPRGYTIPHAAVVSAKVVRECAEFRALFGDRRYRFFAHNAPVDVHVFHNEGIEIVNVVNTLTLARWTWPGRARAAWGGGGFGLDALGKDVLGEGKLEAFTELFTETVEHWVPQIVKRCACGDTGCRKRSLPAHAKTHEEERVLKLETVPVPLEVVVPGHPLFARAVRYAAQDAVLAHALKQIIYRELNKQIREVPWIKRTEQSEGVLTTM